MSKRGHRTERQVIMDGAEIRSVLAGTKTQFRRLILPQPPEMPAVDCHPDHQQMHPQPYLDAYCGQKVTPENPRGMSEEWLWWQVDNRACFPRFKCPFGAPGDTLWVREKWALVVDLPLSECVDASDINFAATASEALYATTKWRASIVMPRWAARIFLKIENVRVCRLMEITEEDAKAEGVPAFSLCGEGKSFRAGVASRWNHQNKSFWNENPWVWAVNFQRIKQKREAA